MPRIKLTKSAIDALATPASDVVYWDASCPGFGLKITPMGRKVFIVLYRTGGVGSNYGNEIAPSHSLSQRLLTEATEHKITEHKVAPSDQKLQPLRHQFAREKIDPCEVAARPGEAGDKTKPDRLIADVKDDGDRRGCGPRAPKRSRPPRQ